MEHRDILFIYLRFYLFERETEIVTESMIGGERGAGSEAQQQEHMSRPELPRTEATNHIERMSS